MKHAGTQAASADVATQAQLADKVRRFETTGALPSGTRQAGDVWYDSEANITSDWIVGTNGGAWVARATGGASWLPLTSGDIEVTDFTKGVILRSPDGSRKRLQVNNANALTVTTL